MVTYRHYLIRSLCQACEVSIAVYSHLPIKVTVTGTCEVKWAPLRHMFKKTSLEVLRMLSLNLWQTTNQRSGQVYHIVLPREAYYSCQVSRVCVVSA